MRFDKARQGLSRLLDWLKTTGREPLTIHRARCLGFGGPRNDEPADGEIPATKSTVYGGRFVLERPSWRERALLWNAERKGNIKVVRVGKMYFFHTLLPLEYYTVRFTVPAEQWKEAAK